MFWLIVLICWVCVDCCADRFIVTEFDCFCVAVGAGAKRIS